MKKDCNKSELNEQQRSKATRKAKRTNLVLVYTFAVKQGLIKRFKIQMKKHKGGKIYQAVSTFRHRLSWLLCSFKNMRQLINLFQNIQSAKVNSSNPMPT